MAKFGSLKEIGRPKVKTGKNFSKYLFTYGGTLLIIVLLFFVVLKMSADARNDIGVVAFKQDMISKSVIDEKSIKEKKIKKADYDKDMILYEERESILGQFTNYYVRRDTPIFKDQVTVDNPLRNDYLYTMKEGQELITLPYNFREAGGTIVVPGDRVRIRVSYMTSDGGYGQVTNVETLFRDVVVEDLLNSSGLSIFEEYKRVNRLSEKEKQEALADTDFLRKVTPTSMTFIASEGEATSFSKVKTFDRLNYTITLLARRNVKGDADVIKDIIDLSSQSGVE